MKVFQEIGEHVEKLWRDKNYDEEIFPAIAAQALKESGLPEKVTAWEVIEWTLHETHLPSQKDLPGRFGDPPITLFNSSRFHVDVYFWLEGTTALHQHAFCGAFQVLHGSSIHSWYEFERQEKVNAFVEIGDMNLKVCELLNVGDVQEIWAGREYIHSLFHLDQPSATIVVRTHKSPLYLPQYSYHKPVLAIDPFFEDPDTIKKLQCVTALIRSKHPDTDQFIVDLLEQADFQATYSILGTVRGYLQNNQLDQLFKLDAPKDREDKFMEVIKKRHGHLADVFPKIFAHEQKVNEIINRRQYITDNEQRFFLALLMNVDGKERIMSLVQERFPDDKPMDKILDWIFDLSQTKVLGLNVPNALGVADFDDFDLFILECFLKDLSDDEIETTLKKEYPSESSTEMLKTLGERKEKIREAAIFKPLLLEQTSKQSA